MPDHLFHFAMDMSGRPSPEMIRALAAQVVKFVGCSGATAGSIVDGVERAVSGGWTNGGPAPGSLRVLFRAAKGELHVEVTSDARAVWQASHPIA